MAHSTLTFHVLFHDLAHPQESTSEHKAHLYQISNRGRATRHGEISPYAKVHIIFGTFRVGGSRATGDLCRDPQVRKLDTV